MIAAGQSNQEIADLLYIAPDTFRVHSTPKSGLILLTATFETSSDIEYNNLF